MIRPSKEIGKPDSPEDRVFIPPHTCRVQGESSTQPLEIIRGGQRSAVEFLTDGQLHMWPFGRHILRRRLSDREVGRFVRVFADPEEEVGRVLRSILAVDGSGGMYPPPTGPPTDPGGDNTGDSDDGSGESAVFPIADNELGITRPLFDQVVEELSFRGKEEAGLLFGPKATQVATFFLRDKRGKKTPSSFTLDTASLNTAIRAVKPWNLQLLAVVHCHPNGVWQPSGGDIRYVRDLFAHPRNGSAKQFFMPLVVNGQFIPYLLYRDEPDRVVRAGLKIIG